MPSGRETVGTVSIAATMTVNNATAPKLLQAGNEAS